jgi:hypothetical protein
VPGITTNYDSLGFVGHDSEAKLLGLFQVNILHNLVHVAFGVAGIAAAAAVRSSRLFLVGGGIVYLGLWLYGVAIDLDGAANFVSLNTADNWLHLLLGAGIAGTGLALADAPRRHPFATTQR